MARYETNDAVGPIGHRSALNELFADTSFLQGANAAYIEYLLAAFEANPASVSSDWRQFFTDMGHQAGTPTTLSAPSSKGLKSLSTEDPDLIAAFAGDFNASSALTPITTTASEDVKRATRDSVRALMMIRAYRMRGHLHAHLDPLGLEQRQDHGVNNRAGD